MSARDDLVGVLDVAAKFAVGACTQHEVAEAMDRLHKLRPALLALLDAEPVAWQPIETAPKDGNHILLYRPEIMFVGYYATKGEVWCINAPGLPVMYPQPTHWMPLPARPEASPCEYCGNTGRHKMSCPMVKPCAGMEASDEGR